LGGKKKKISECPQVSKRLLHQELGKERVPSHGFFFGKEKTDLLKAIQGGKKKKMAEWNTLRREGGKRLTMKKKDT